MLTGGQDVGAGGQDVGAGGHDVGAGGDDPLVPSTPCDSSLLSLSPLLFLVLENTPDKHKIFRTRRITMIIARPIAIFLRILSILLRFF